MTNSLTALNPYVRYAARCSGNTIYEALVAAYDFRLFYVLRGSMTAEFADRKIAMGKYSLLSIPHSVPYRLIFSGEQTEYININFDLDSGHTGIPPQRPEPAAIFDRSKVVSEYMVDEFNEILVTEEAYPVEGALTRIAEEKYMGIPSGYLSNEIASAYLKEALIMMLQLRSRLAVPGIISEILAYIGENYSKPVTNSSIAAHFRYHPYYLNRVFLGATGKTMHSYIIHNRLKEAARKLVSTNDAVKDIALSVGFDTASYFSKYFKAVYGLTPLGYRRQNRIF